MSDITLTAAVRSNLSTLQNTASLISQTSERLSTGNKVNSALDNPNSFFTASSLNSRASDLSNLQDDIGQSVSTLDAADKGIGGINKLLDAAKGKANQALQSKDESTRAKYAEEFNELRTQIEDIAKDSGYKGKNLLGGDGNDLTVKFNEDGSSQLKIGAVDYTDLDSENSSFTLDKIGSTKSSVTERNEEAAFSLGRTPSTDPNAGKFDIGITAGAAITGASNISAINQFEEGDKITLSAGDQKFEVETKDAEDLDATALKIQTELRKIDGNDAATVTFNVDKFEISGANEDFKIGYEAAGTTATGFTDTNVAGEEKLLATTKLEDLDAFKSGDVIEFQLGDGNKSSFDVTGKSVSDLATAIGGLTGVTANVADDKINIDVTDQDLKFSFKGDGAGAEFSDPKKNEIGKDLDAVDGRGWGDDDLIEKSLEQVRTAQTDLRAQASTFGTNLSVVTNRQDFTSDLINTLQTGAGKLTLADSNLEGANLAALNTQNSIATTTLSLATQAGQSVLQLIR
ncbi:flagellin [Pseudovibrio sp. Tun.PSC04-5.I4]|uniref:flagellin N-terminal helical domain-containing protein n=1 Tax=Pseudovibrio sp. Tun.PSC04-5.I4 TaxID=1798213 RepID=UPI0008869010|nr:flagellin [Pseudovibrio sp. Tun.PSC04-5.I4]SDR36998.1 Flagellin FlgL [Pseudovibrio sp. Tun.PSC04-5.I4]